MAWGEMIEGAAEVTGCKNCGNGVMHHNYNAMMQANGVNTDFSSIPASKVAGGTPGIIKQGKAIV